MKKKVLISGLIVLAFGMASCSVLQKNTNKAASETAVVADGSVNSIVEKYWKLTALFGVAIAPPEGAKEAHLIFKKEGNRVNGNGGCNVLNGTYTLRPGNKISFSQMASTLMMCLNMDIETQMKKALELTDNYTVNANTLILNNSKNEPIARFEVVYLR